MSTIEHKDSIDAIGIDKAIGIVILKIFDHLDWNDEMRHLLLLQDKINSYLNFIESGEIYEAYPNAKNRLVQISIIFHDNPTENGLKFIDTAKQIIQDAGFELTYLVTGLIKK